jgi:hypothetical protein
MRAGPRDSAVVIECELRRGKPPVDIPPIAWRMGIDLAPSPDDEWLRACVFADHPDRLARLDAALEVAKEHPPALVRGDAIELLPGLICQAPADTQVIVFHTAVAPYIPFDRWQALADAAGGATYVTAEHAGDINSHSLRVDGAECGTAHPHGRWLDWTA